MGPDPNDISINIREDHRMRSRPVKIYFDGGCRPNPGQMETAVVHLGVVYHRRDCGVGDSNDAEWSALIHAAEIAVELNVDNAVFMGDSAFVVASARLALGGHVGGHSGRFAAELDRFQRLAAKLEHVRIRKVARTQNLAGIALAAARLWD
jgi:ribonuclease HI